MFQSLVIFHRDLTEGQTLHFTSEPGFVCWNTCVRSLLIGWNPAGRGTSQNFHRQYHGFEAARFLVEIVCGLQSPVIGETEVHGQFKKMVDENRLAIPLELVKFLSGVLILSRKVRTQHLQSLGSQSYGSFARKKVKGLRSVLVLGSGHLAQEILPWLAKTDVQVQVAVRDLTKVDGLQRRFPRVEFVPYGEWSPVHQALLVAAPLPASVVKDFEQSLDGLKTILDFRSDSQTDCILSAAEVVSLDSIFSEIELTRGRVTEQVSQAKAAIEAALHNLEGEVGRHLASMKIS